MADEFNPFRVSAPSERKALIVAAARALLADGGSDLVTRKTVAKRTGLTPSEISRHFKDRSALLKAIKLD